MMLGRDQHLLEQLAVSLLDPAAARDLRLGFAKAGGEAIADPLELGNAEDPRPAAGADAPLDSLAGERGGEQLAQAALEQRDLAPKLGADPAVGKRELVEVRARRRDRRWRPGDRVPVEQFLGQAGLPSPWSASPEV
jgi:hypothetical protein